MKEIAAYDYTDESSETLYQVVRFEPKEFRARRPDGNGGWIYGLNGINRVPYRLHDIHGARVVVVCEGEKDADNVHRLGLPATCATGGANGWSESLAEYFRGKRIAVIPDNDEPGERYAAEVAQNLHGIAEMVKVVRLPGLPEKGDVTDWIEAGGTKSLLLELINEVSEYKPAVVSEDPDPLRRVMPAPEPYPVDALPPVLRAVVRKTADIYQCPPALAGQSFIGAVALAVQGHADVEIDGRTVPLCVFIITVGESGERKSAIDKLALSPVHDHQRNLHDSYQLQVAEWEAEKLTWKKQRDDILKSKNTLATKSNLIELGLEPYPPLEPMLVCEEPTYEAIQKTLHRGHPSLGLFSDEGGRFIGGHAMNTDNRLKTSAGLSGFWDGKSVTRTRAGEGNITLYGKRLSMHLMIQPVVLDEILSSDILTQQGLLTRCLLTCPESTLGKRKYQEQSE